MPAFYNIDNSSAVFPDFAAVRENYMKYLFPWIEAHYSVQTIPSGRAFSGLSLGGVLLYEMYRNATDYFDYFGHFSGVAGPNASLELGT